MIKPDITSAEFLNQALGGPYTELNPVTGKPRLILGLNEVWQKINEFGGITFTTGYFGVSEKFLQQCIDDHYLPSSIAKVIADKLHYKNSKDFIYPSLGYEDPKTELSWPWGWYYSCVEQDADKLLAGSILPEFQG